MKRLGVVLLVWVVAVCGGCGPLMIRDGVPVKPMDAAVVPVQSPLIRTWGDDVSDEFQQRYFVEAAIQREAYHLTNPSAKPEQLNVLSISGGGENGAFGAGRLNGWTERGTRPEFQIVTGVSTGVLTPPMALIGKPSDQRLKDAHTTVTSKDVFIIRPLLQLFRADSISDNRALVKLIQRFVDRKILDLIAAEHAKGRRLLVATTDLDAQRPVIWDLNAIASSPDPDKLRLFRDILRASASIPALFPPVYLGVAAAGKKYREMHVDGRTTMQVFLFGLGIGTNVLARA